MTCKEVSAKELGKALKNTSVLVALFFSEEEEEKSARRVERLLKDIDGRSYPHATACKIDIEEVIQLSQKLSIRKTPTLVFFLNGESKYSISGNISIDYIRTRLEVLKMMDKKVAPDM
ncbi:MAG: thioredoxin family protein [Candidatus Paceibacterota bacterium]